MPPDGSGRRQGLTNSGDAQVTGRRRVMTWALMPLRRYAVFSGRSRRKEYWMFLLLFPASALDLFWDHRLARGNLRPRREPPFLACQPRHPGSVHSGRDAETARLGKVGVAPAALLHPTRRDRPLDHLDGQRRRRRREQVRPQPQDRGRLPAARNRASLTARRH
jgi:hypothetical protein